MKKNKPITKEEPAFVMPTHEEIVTAIKGFQRILNALEAATKEDEIARAKRKRI